MVDRALIEELSDSETALLCNAMSALELSEPHTYSMDGTIQCLTPELPPLVAQAITIKVDTCTPGKAGNPGPFQELQRQAAEISVPLVVVAETTSGTPMRECVMGDGMAKGFMATGIQGLVTDGGVRDMPGIAAQGFRVFAVGRVVQHGNLHWSELNAPVSVGGITVNNGDLIHADEGGCIVVPKENHLYIAEACRLVQRFEKEAHTMIRRSDLSIEQKTKEMERIGGAHMVRIAQLKKTSIANN